MIYTGKGDDGSTSVFGHNLRISKSSALSNALGSLDETNSLLGLVRSRYSGGGDFDFLGVIEEVQNDLFVAQAHVGGADTRVKEEHVAKLESWIVAVETKLPPIKNFIMPGGSELSAILDYARSVARRAERHVVAAHEEGNIKEAQYLLAYTNRLSSLLFVLARLANNESGKTEKAPRY